MTPSSILIVRLSAIGDVIHALPVLAALREALPAARIGWAVEELAAPLLENHPHIDKLYVIPKKRWKKEPARMYFAEIRPYFAAMRADKWDAALDLHGLTKSGFVAKWSGAKLRVGYGDEDGREINKLLTNRRVKPPSDARHVVERNLSLLRGLGIEPNMKARGVIGIRHDERAAMVEKLKQAGWDGSQPLVALNPGGGWESKLWPPDRYAAVGAAIAREEGFRPLVLWGPREEPMRDRIVELLAKEQITALVAPPTKVREMAVLISLMHLFIGGDTGPTHLAGLFGVPTVSLFGASDGARNRPWPIESGPMQQRTDIECVPCWKTKCPLPPEQFMRCLKGIDVTGVVKAARVALQKTAANSR